MGGVVVFIKISESIILKQLDNLIKNDLLSEIKIDNVTFFGSRAYVGEEKNEREKTLIQNVHSNTETTYS